MEERYTGSQEQYRNGYDRIFKKQEEKVEVENEDNKSDDRGQQ